MEITEHCGGTLCGDKDFLMHDKECQDQSENQQKKPEVKQETFDRNREKFLAHGFLANCDKRRSGQGTSLEDLENNFTLGNDKHQKTLQKACEYLMNCKKFTPKEKKNNKNDSNRGGVSFAQAQNNQNNNHGDRRSCWGDGCWGGCNNPDCVAHGGNRNNETTTTKMTSQMQ